MLFLVVVKVVRVGHGHGGYIVHGGSGAGAHRSRRAVGRGPCAVQLLGAGLDAGVGRRVLFPLVTARYGPHDHLMVFVGRRSDRVPPNRAHSASQRGGQQRRAGRVFARPVVRVMVMMVVELLVLVRAHRLGAGHRAQRALHFVQQD